jgi:hypothetical protein
VSLSLSVAITSKTQLSSSLPRLSQSRARSPQDDVGLCCLVESKHLLLITLLLLLLLLVLELLALLLVQSERRS